MNKRRVCRKCRSLIDGDTCPVSDPDCPVVYHNDFGTTFQGRVFVNIPEKSLIAKKMGFRVRGEYAIKVK